MSNCLLHFGSIGFNYFGDSHPSFIYSSTCMVATPSIMRHKTGIVGTKGLDTHEINTWSLPSKEFLSNTRPWMIFNTRLSGKIVSAQDFA